MPAKLTVQPSGRSSLWQLRRNHGRSPQAPLPLGIPQGSSHAPSTLAAPISQPPQRQPEACPFHGPKSLVSRTPPGLGTLRRACIVNHFRPLLRWLPFRSHPHQPGGVPHHPGTPHARRLPFTGGSADVSFPQASASWALSATFSSFRLLHSATTPVQGTSLTLPLGVSSDSVSAMGPQQSFSSSHLGR